MSLLLRARVLLPLACLLATAGLRADVKVELFTFADLVTAPDVKPKWSWHSIGIDPDDNVYAVFGGPSGPAGDLADCILVQYRARTGQRRFLGLLSDAAKAAGTLRPGEHIEKGHSQILWQNGRMYLGTLGFHDAAVVGSPRMKLALASHGAHLMSYDPAADRIEDLSRDQPEGVFFPGRGFMTLAAMPERNLIVAYTVPHGDLLFYDTRLGRVHATVPGVPAEFGRHVSREIIPTADGKIYYAYTSAQNRNEPGHMYCYDLATNRRSEQPLPIAARFWNTQARTKDGTGIYLSNQPGEVFQFHPATGTVELIGYLTPEDERRPISDDRYDYAAPTTLGMALSADEKFLYAIPTRNRFGKAADGAPRAAVLPADDGDGETDTRRKFGMAPQGVYAFELATRKSRRVAPWPAEIGSGYISGAGIRDSQGNLYFVRHGGGPSGNYGIIKVSFPSAR